MSEIDVCKWRTGGWWWIMEKEGGELKGKEAEIERGEGGDVFNDSELWGEESTQKQLSKTPTGFAPQPPVSNNSSRLFACCCFHTQTSCPFESPPLSYFISKSVFFLSSHWRVIHPLRLSIKTIREQHGENKKKKNEKKWGLSLKPNLPERCTNNFLN